MDPDRADCIAEAARYLATEPAAVERAVARHRRRADGTCTGCGPTLEDWPCATASIARLAREIIGSPVTARSAAPPRSG